MSGFTGFRFQGLSWDLGLRALALIIKGVEVEVQGIRSYV